jgi:hypothetical protein
VEGSSRLDGYQVWVKLCKVKPLAVGPMLH